VKILLLNKRSATCDWWHRQKVASYHFHTVYVKFDTRRNGRTDGQKCLGLNNIALCMLAHADTRWKLSSHGISRLDRYIRTHIHSNIYISGIWHRHLANIDKTCWPLCINGHSHFLAVWSSPLTFWIKAIQDQGSSRTTKATGSSNLVAL